MYINLLHTRIRKKSIMVKNQLIVIISHHRNVNKKERKKTGRRKRYEIDDINTYINDANENMN